jgi:hypothetical protein
MAWERRHPCLLGFGQRPFIEVTQARMPALSEVSQGIALPGYGSANAG